MKTFKQFIKEEQKKSGYEPDEKTVEAALRTIRKKESDNNYGIRTKNPGSDASGAYQYISTTWQQQTKKHGIGTEYKHAADAPPEIQDAVARRNVKDILKQTKGDVSKVPLVWYTGNPEGKISQRALDVNKGLQPPKYQKDWMDVYNKDDGGTQKTSAPPSAPKAQPISKAQPAPEPNVAKAPAPKAPSTPKPAEQPVSAVKTQAGDYPVYKAGSESAQEFGKAFAAARGAGAKEFEWQGRKYGTELKK